MHAPVSANPRMRPAPVHTAGDFAMRPICVAVLAILATSTAYAGNAHTRYLELINRAHDSMASFAVAAPGSDAFVEVPLGAPLRGGGDSTTLEIADAGCRYDLRFMFVDGRSSIYRGVDICRYPKVRIRHLPRADENGLASSRRP